MLLFKSFVSLLFFFFRVASPINTVSCFLNFKSPCQPSTPIYDPLAMTAYISRYNTFVKSCNLNPDIANVSSSLISPMIDSVLNMDCQGNVPYSTQSNLSYNYNKQCGLMEVYSSLYACINANKKKHDLLVYTNTSFLNIIYNAPQSQCIFLGLGTMDNFFEKTVWIQSSRMFPNLTNTLAHEIGHTKGLQHSGAVGSSWEYADCSCPMGCASTINLCFNAPNANALGWAKPIIIKQQNFITNNWNYILLPIYATTYYNNILINNTQTNTPIILSLRSSKIEPGIDDLSLMNFNQVYIPIDKAISIHIISNTTQRSMFFDAIAPQSQWDGSILGIKVFFKHVIFLPSLNGSMVSFCFYQKTLLDCV